MRASDGKEKTSLYPGILPHHFERLRLFEKENAELKPGATIFVGDSITEAFPIAQLADSERAVNRGINGDLIGGWKYIGLIDRLTTSVIAAHPSRVFILIGINDIIQANMLNMPQEMTPLPNKILNYKRILAQMHKQLPDCKIYVQSLFPLGRDFAKLNPHVLAFNSELKKLAAQQHCEFIDLHKAFVNAEGKLPDNMTPDGIHPSPEGYKEWLKLLPLEKKTS